ncbi:MAG: glycosyltransferase [Candidatus Levybacteria bacterium]|nr:glycosyltransferase [Candidatus Levybacteria bacterium]
MKIQNSKFKITETKPLVSVIMPVFNAGSFLTDAIESILHQTYKNIEFIIVDDCSTDESWKIIKSYQKKYPSIIKTIRLKKNLNKGGDSCANIALKYARGKYIARMDADDISGIDRLEKQVEFLEKNPDIFMVGSNAHVINTRGIIIGEKLEPLTNNDIYKSYARFHPIIHPSIMLRRLISAKRFYYQIKYSANNDYHTFFKLICTGFKFANLEEKLVYYRIHSTNDTFVNIKNKFMNTLKIRLRMFMHYNYKPTPKDVLISFIQSVLLFALPERVTKDLYLISKGIIKIKDLILPLQRFIPFSVN